MTLRDEISRLLDDNQLQDAIGLARDHVKTRPTDKDGRHFYRECADCGTSALYFTNPQ